MRCPLLVPCDAGDGLDAALACGADALVLDLGDAAAPEGRAAARRWAAAALARLGPPPRRPTLALRVAALPTGLVDLDLDAVMPGVPDAVLLPGAAGAADVQRLAAKLAVREAEAGLAAGSTRIVAVADTARGVLALGTLRSASARLTALLWDPIALAAEVGAVPARDAAPLAAARGLVVLAAAAAGVPAVDGASPAGSPDLAADVRAARRDGFGGRLALHPDQVAVILARFASRPP